MPSYTRWPSIASTVSATSPTSGREGRLSSNYSDGDEEEKNTLLVSIDRVSVPVQRSSNEPCLCSQCGPIDNATYPDGAAEEEEDVWYPEEEEKVLIWSPSGILLLIPSSVSVEGPAPSGSGGLLLVDLVHKTTRQMQRWIVWTKPLPLPTLKKVDGVNHVLMRRVNVNLSDVNDVSDCADLVARGVRGVLRTRAADDNAHPFQLLTVEGQAYLSTRTFSRLLPPASPEDQDYPLPVGLTNEELLLMDENADAFVVVTPPESQSQCINDKKTYLILHPSAPHMPCEYRVWIFGRTASEWKVKRVGLVWAAPIRGVDGPNVKRIKHWAIWTNNEECASGEDGLDFDVTTLDRAEKEEEPEESEEEEVDISLSVELGHLHIVEAVEEVLA